MRVSSYKAIVAVPLAYKKPRRINVVSISLVLVFAAIAFAVWGILPMIFRKHEAFRVLEETGSTFRGRQGYYLADKPAYDHLLDSMSQRLRMLGVTDPEMDWGIDIDSEPGHAIFYVVYTDAFHLPYDFIAPILHEYELEYKITLREGLR